MTSLKTEICGIDFNSCLMNASGCLCRTNEEILKLDECDSGAIVSKTSTYEKRQGNPEPRYYHNEMLSINSMGLPNEGIEHYMNMSNYVSKPYIMSVSAGTINQDIISIAQSTYGSIKGIEINVSCPNLAGKSQIDYNFENFDNFLRKLFQEEYEVPLGLKLSPYFSHEQFGKAADIINDYPISFLTTINGLGNGLVINYEKEETVIKMSKLTKCDIIGCGGISSGQDAFEYILAGASAVQIGTQFMREKHGVFNRIGNELKNIMDSKGYVKIYDFKGKFFTKI